MSEVMELARFGVFSGTSASTVRERAATMEPWLKKQPGFIARSLTGPDDDGRYLDVVRWRTREHALAAAEEIGKAPDLRPFMEIIDPKTVEMRHVPVVLNQ